MREQDLAWQLGIVQPITATDAIHPARLPDAPNLGGGRLPETLVFCTCANRLIQRRHKPRSKPKQLLKDFGLLVIADIRSRCSIGYTGLQAA